MQTTQLSEAEAVFLDNFPAETNFERGIFISWYCSIGDCTFCFMSTQKNRITDPKKARRSLESVIAEAIIIKKCGWDVEFVSGGYGGFSKQSLVDFLKNIYQIYGNKLWLNVGVLNGPILTAVAPYLEGVYAAIESINPEIHARVCPSKPVAPYIKMFKICDRLGLRKAMTMITGLGETMEDFDRLSRFIAENGVERITFYPHNPVKGTELEGAGLKPPEYTAEWISKTRIAFPTMEIVVGPWVQRVADIGLFLRSGAHSVANFPGIKLFNSTLAHEFEAQAVHAGRKMKGTLTKLPVIDVDAEVGRLDLSSEQKAVVAKKLQEYMDVMSRN